MNISGLYDKLNSLSNLALPFQNRILQVYVKMGQYTQEQLLGLETKLKAYIKDFELKSDVRITVVK